LLFTQYAKGLRSSQMIKVWDIYIFYTEIKYFLRGSFQRTEKSARLTKKNREEHLGNLHYENKI